MVEELSLEEELIEYKNNALEYLDDICSTINESFEYFNGPWNDSILNRYSIILKDLSKIKTILNSIVEDKKI